MACHCAATAVSCIACTRCYQRHFQMHHQCFDHCQQVTLMTERARCLLLLQQVRCQDQDTLQAARRNDRSSCSQAERSSPHLLLQALHACCVPACAICRLGVITRGPLGLTCRLVWVQLSSGQYSVGCRTKCWRLCCWRWCRRLCIQSPCQLRGSWLCSPLFSDTAAVQALIPALRSKGKCGWAQRLTKIACERTCAV